MTIKPKHSLTSVADYIADGFQKGKMLPTSAVYDYIVGVKKFIAMATHKIPTFEEALRKSDTARPLLVLTLRKELLVKQIEGLLTQILYITEKNESLNRSQRRRFRKLTKEMDLKLVNLWGILHTILTKYDKSKSDAG